MCLVREEEVQQVSESVSGRHQWSSMSMNLSKSIFLPQMACNTEIKTSVLLLANSYVPPSPPSHNQGDPLGQRSQVTAGREGKGSPPLGRIADLFI